MNHLEHILQLSVVHTSYHCILLSIYKTYRFLIHDIHPKINFILILIIQPFTVANSKDIRKYNKMRRTGLHVHKNVHDMVMYSDNDHSIPVIIHKTFLYIHQYTHICMTVYHPEKFFRRKVFIICAFTFLHSKFFST